MPQTTTDEARERYEQAEQLMATMYDLMGQYLEAVGGTSLLTSKLADDFALALDANGWQITQKGHPDGRWFLNQPLDDPSECPAWADNGCPPSPPGTVWFVDEQGRIRCKVRRMADVLQLIPGGKPPPA